MKQVVCWKQENKHIDLVFQTEADESHRGVYRAVHTSMKLQRRDLGAQGEPRLTGELTEQQVREDLLAPDTEHVLMPVLGDSGSGKSHLIRWLGEHIPEAPNRRVVQVRRSDTVRRVLEKILEGQDGEVFDKARVKLAQAHNDDGPAQRRQRFLNDLVVEAAGYFGPDESTQLRMISKYAEHLLYEPTVRESLLKSDSVIDRIVANTAERSDETPGDERRTEFTAEDLAATLKEIDLGSLGSNQKRALGFFENSKNLDELVRLLNEVRGNAARRLLNFNAGDIDALFQEVRRQLRKTDVELVLLVEDLVSQTALSQPLVALAMQGPDHASEEGLMCVMRTAMACTTGEFNRYLETVRTRVRPYSVWVSINDEASAESYLTDIGAAYLNAARLDRQILDALKSGDAGSKAPNACDACEYREPCHAAFGASPRGHGYYPMNRAALTVLGRSATKGNRLQIRKFLGSVRDVVRDGANGIPENRFPKPTLVRRLLEDHDGAYSVTPGDRARIDSTLPNPADQERAVALVELWGHGSVAAVPKALASALALKLPTQDTPQPPPNPNSGPQDDQPRTNSPKIEPPPTEPAPDDTKLKRFLNALAEWSKRKPIDEANMKRVRDLLQDELERAIDVNDLLVRPTAVAGSGREFSPESIRLRDFSRRPTSAAARSATLTELPVDDTPESRRRLAVTIENLARAQKSGWGKLGPAAYADAMADVRAIAKTMTDRFRERYGPPTDDKQDPLYPLAWLLVWAQRLAGRPTPAASAEPQARIRYLFEPPPKQPESEFRSKPWRAMLTDLAKSDWRPWLEARSLLANMACGVKSEGALQIVIDAERIDPLIRLAMQPDAPNPDLDSIPEAIGFADAKRSIDKLANNIQAALEAETSTINAREAEWMSLFGDEDGFNSATADATKLLKVFNDHGVPETKLEPLRKAVRSLQQLKPSTSEIGVAQRLADASTHAAKADVLAAAIGRNTSAIDEFVSEARVVAAYGLDHLDRQIQAAPAADEAEQRQKQLLDRAAQIAAKVNASISAPEDVA